MILQALLISSVMFSYSFRKPVIDLPTIPYDYEYRIGFDGENDSLKYSIKFLYEREIGKKGYGHDLDASLNSSIKLNKKYKAKHNISSYVREVKNFRVTSYDYVLNVLPSLYAGLGLTLNNHDLFEVLYIGYNYGILDASLRLGIDNVVKDIKIQKEYKISSNTYLVPYMRYKAINSKEDYQGKLLLKYKI